MAGTLDDLFTEINGVELPRSVASDWGLASPVPEVTLPQADPVIPPQPGPPITNWNQVREEAPPPPDTEDTYNFAPEDLTQHVSQGAQQLASGGGRGSLSVKARVPGRADPMPEGELDPGQEADLAAVYGTRMGALMEKADAEQGLIDVDEAVRSETSAFNEREAREGMDRKVHIEDQRLQREEWAARMAAQDEAEIEQKRLAVKSVDPARRWKDASGFQKAAGFIGAFLGGFMEPVTGKNTALATIMQIIDNDIRAQMADIETQREDVYRQERAAERKMGRRETANARAYAADVGNLEWWQEQRIYRLDAAIDSTMKEAAQYKSKLNRANAQDAAGVLMEGARQAKEQLMQMKWQRRIQAYEAKTGRINANAHMVSANASATDANTRANAAGATDDGVYIGEPGTQDKIKVDTNVPVTKEHYSKLMERQRLRRDLGQKVKDYYELAESVGRRYRGAGANTRLGSEDAALLESAFRDVAVSRIKMTSGAAFTKEEMKATEDMIGQPPGLVGQLPGQRLKRLLRTMGDDESTDFDHVRATKNGEKYNPRTFYTAPEVYKPENITVNQLRDKTFSADPLDVAKATEALSDQMSVPGEKAALRQNFPSLQEEIEVNIPRAMVEAKARGDTQTLERLQNAYKSFMGNWSKMERRGLFEPEPVDEIEQYEHPLIGPAW